MTDTLTGSAPPVVRAARPGDISLLAGWACAMAWETEQKRLDAEIVARGVSAVFEQPARASYFIAEQLRDGVVAPIGTLMLTCEWSDWRCGDWWWIQSVYIDPGHRRRGAYRALHGHVRQLAMTQPQVCGLRLYVEKGNSNAQRTYASLGMSDAGYAMFEEEFDRH